MATVVATVFATQYMSEAGLGSDWHATIQKYAAAANLAQQLLQIDSTIIKRIRKSKPVISQLTADDLLAENPNIPTTLAEALTAPF